MLFHQRARARAFLLAGVGIVAWAASNCSASSENPAGGTDAATGSGGSGGTVFDDAGAGTGGTGTGGLDPDAACGLITEKATSTPLALYIAFDKSSSMSGTKWDSAKLGLAAFVNDPDSAGIKVALNFFPLDNTPTTCDQFAYKPPKVAFGLLPPNALPITMAMDAATPNGFSTPIYPALGGAILGAKEQADNNPGETAAVMLVTDGQPSGPTGTCAGVNPEDSKAIADLAKTGTTFGIKTFVIGLQGVNQAFANEVALAGGTDAAIVVSAINTQVEFQQALAKVRGEALPCEYELPAKVEGGEIDPGLVNILLTPKGGKAALLPQNPSCKGEGWKYDDPKNPKHIELCPDSCTALKTDFGALVQILMGCKTEVAK